MGSGSRADVASPPGPAGYWAGAVAELRSVLRHRRVAEEALPGDGPVAAQGEAVGAAQLDELTGGHGHEGLAEELRADGPRLDQLIDCEAADDAHHDASDVLRRHREVGRPEVARPGLHRGG